MSEHYHDPSDVTYMRMTRTHAPEAFKGFAAMDAASFSPEGPVPLKYVELTALALTLLTQCPYCIEAHTKKAKAQGATREEVAQMMMLAATMRASASVAHGWLAWKFYDEAEG